MSEQDWKRLKNDLRLHKLDTKYLTAALRDLQERNEALREVNSRLTKERDELKAALEASSGE